MSILLDPPWLDRVIRYTRHLLPISILYIIVHATGLVSSPLIGVAWVAGLLGAAMGGLARWRQEPGLWMLASLYGAISGAFAISLGVFSILDHARGIIVFPSLPIAASLFLMLLVLAFMTWFCASIAAWNCRLAR